MSFSQRDKIFGLLFGCAYGDAMGMPSEMMCRTILDETFPDGIHALLPSSQNDFFNTRMENLIRNYTFVNYYDGQMKIQKRMLVKLDHLLQRL